jgi:hypothetical protein
LEFSAVGLSFRKWNKWPKSATKLSRQRPNKLLFVVQGFSPAHGLRVDTKVVAKGRAKALNYETFAVILKSSPDNGHNGPSVRPFWKAPWKGKGLPKDFRRDDSKKATPE